jgi:hypothetical protein
MVQWSLFNGFLISFFRLLGFVSLDLNGSEGSSDNETATTPGSSLTSSTTNSKIIIDSSDDIIPIQSEYDSVRSSVIFFSASLSMFAAIGVIIFFRKCVNCPSGQQDGQNRHGRHHYYTAGGEIAHFRTLVGRAPNVVTTVELDDTLDVDVTGIDVPLTPSPNTKLANSDEDEEINSPTTNHLRTTCHLPLISIGDSTSGFRFYDDDEQEEGEEENDQTTADCT